MARQFSSLTQPLATHYLNYNQTVTYLGDLNNLNAEITSDSDLVAAINYVYANSGLDSGEVTAIVQPLIDSNHTDILALETSLQTNIDSNHTDILAREASLQTNIDSNHTDILELTDLVDSALGVADAVSGLTNFSVNMYMSYGREEEYVTFVQYATRAFRVNKAYAQTVFGEIDVEILRHDSQGDVSGIVIPGLEAFTVSTTSDSATASSDNEFPIGSMLAAQFTNDQGSEMVSITLDCTRI